MKIINPAVYQVKGVSSSAEEVKKEGASGTSFSEILESAASNHGAEKTVAASGSKPLDQAETLTPVQKEALAKGEEVLGLLGHICSQLESSPISGVAARSAADAISSRVNELRLMRDSLDASDPLRDTLDEIGTISIVEQVKITRGDYG